MKKRAIKKYLSEKTIARRVKKLAKDISRDYKGKKLVVIGVLKGSFLFLADLVKNLTIPVEIDFVQAASYGAAMTSSGQVKIKKKNRLSLKGKEVLVVEDIVDYGHTLKTIFCELKKSQPLSVKTCVLLNKPSRRKVPLALDYVGFTVPDYFLVGYGMDFNENYRALPYIGQLNNF